jgi:hypothetical protein
LDDTGIFIKTQSNAIGAKLRFSDHTNGYAQVGSITYRHADNQVATGSNDGLIFEGSEPRSMFNFKGEILVDSSIRVGNNIRSASDAGAGAIRWNGATLQNSTGSEWKDVSLPAPGEEGNPISTGAEVNNTVIPGTNYFKIGSGSAFTAYLTNSFAGGSGWWVRCNYTAKIWEYTGKGGADANNHWNATNTTTSGTATWELSETNINSIRSISSEAWQKFTRGCYGSVDWGWTSQPPSKGNGYAQFKWYDGVQGTTANGAAINSNLAIGGGTAWSTSSTARSPCSVNAGPWNKEVYYMKATTAAGLADLPIRDYSNNDTGATSESSRIHGEESVVWFKIA